MIDTFLENLKKPEEKVEKQVVEEKPILETEKEEALIKNIDGVEYVYDSKGKLIPMEKLMKLIKKSRNKREDF